MRPLSALVAIAAVFCGDATSDAAGPYTTSQGPSAGHPDSRDFGESYRAEPPHQILKEDPLLSFTTKIVFKRSRDRRQHLAINASRYTLSEAPAGEAPMTTVQIPIEVYPGQEPRDAARSVCYMGCTREALQKITRQLEELQQQQQQEQQQQQQEPAGAPQPLWGVAPSLELKLPGSDGRPRATLTLTSAEGAYGSLYRWCQEQRCSAQEFQDLAEQLQGDTKGISSPARAFRNAGFHAHTDKVFHHGYERTHPVFLAHLRFSSLRMLEIGYLEGASSSLWAEYFPRAQSVVFLDIDAPARCRIPDSPCLLSHAKGHKLFHGSSQNRSALRGIAAGEGPFDVIVDDGGHTTAQQLVAFEVLFAEALQPGGVYVIEDVETSYWSLAPQLTTMEYFLKLARGLNRFFYDRQLDVGAAAGLVENVMFGHNCIVVSKKRGMSNLFTALPYRFAHMVSNYSA